MMVESPNGGVLMAEQPGPQRIVILGGGTGGTIMANRLRKHYGEGEASVTVVDRDEAHVYQPGLLFVPFGLTDIEDITRLRSRQLRRGVDYHSSEIESVDIDAQVVHLADGVQQGYDVLGIATGARLVLTALKHLHRTGGKKALVSLCIGGGQGGALWLEKI